MEQARVEQGRFEVKHPITGAIFTSNDYRVAVAVADAYGRAAGHYVVVKDTENE